MNKKPDNRSQDKQTWSAAKRWYATLGESVKWEKLTEAQRLEYRKEYIKQLEA